jgi:hypothetical protein
MWYYETAVNIGCCIVSGGHGWEHPCPKIGAVSLYGVLGKTGIDTATKHYSDREP